MFSKISPSRTCAVIFLIMSGMFQQSYAISDSCRCVAFRLDDIQDYFLNNVQIEIMNTFQKNNKSLTVGIIGNYFGNDTAIVNFLKEKLENNTSSLEIANHGWNHEDFTLFDKQEQAKLIKKTDDKISTILKVKPTGFVAPFNKINSDTVTVLTENRFLYISANVTQDRPPYEIKNESFYHLPSISMTGDLNSDNTQWYGTTHKDTFVQIQNGLINYGFAVVTLHPQEYSKREGLNFSNEVDDAQIQELELLINEIENHGLDIVTISGIPDHNFVHQKTPQWINHLFTWYQAKEISADEVINAIEFLTENKIIKFNL